MTNIKYNDNIFRYTVYILSIFLVVFCLMMRYPPLWVKEYFAYNETIDSIKLYMKDPDSVIIRSYNVRELVESNGYKSFIMCGVVDAKNSFGGYTGGVRFISKTYHLDTQYVNIDNNPDPFNDDQTTAFEHEWKNYCQ